MRMVVMSDKTAARCEWLWWSLQACLHSDGMELAARGRSGACVLRPLGAARHARDDPTASCELKKTPF